MRLRFTILGLELKLLGLLVAELVFLNPAALVLIVEFPLFLYLLWVLEGGLYFRPIGIYILILVAAVIIRKRQHGPDKPSTDPPLKKRLNADPTLDAFVRGVASRLRKPAPQNTMLCLSPVAWRPFGPDLRKSQILGRELALPIGCLGVWSIAEFEAYVARIVVLHRGPCWLFRVVESAIERLSAEQYQVHLQRATNWLVRARGRALQKYLETTSAWHFHADLEADLRAAEEFGAEAVISLAYKTELANLLVPLFITEVVEPALEKQALLPIAESYAAFAAAADPHWRDTVDAGLRDMDKSTEWGSGSLLARLAVLSNLPPRIAMQDPRTASNVFTRFPELEREVAINEFGRPLVESANPVSTTDWASLAVIPQLRDEVARNEEILGGKTRLDIPDLLRGKDDLAAKYRTNPKFLLAHSQKQARIPYLLGAFLALNLADEQWAVSYNMAEGIQLRMGHREIQPFMLVEQLNTQMISDEEFLDTVR